MTISLLFFRLPVVLFSFFFISSAMANNPELQFLVGGKLVEKLSVAELKEKIKSHEVNLTNSLAGEEKKYEAFSIKDVLNVVYDTQWTSDKYSDIAFIALDGYEAVSTTLKLNEEGGFMAFRDADIDQGWKLIGKAKVNPGPFFLVWTGNEQITSNAYPWPWQVTQINLLRFEDQYPTVFPQGATLDSSAYRGFSTFRKRCLHCHSMDRMGGKIGPDLNAPQSIVAYRSERMIKEMIKHASTYRYTIMPDHNDLSDSDLDDLYHYFQFQMAKKRTHD